MDFQKITTAKELVFEMRRISEAIRLIHNAGSITVSLRGCEDGQESKIELSLECSEIGEAVESALHRRIGALHALREENEHLRMGYLAMIREEALKIDPATAEMIWTNGDALDPYALGRVSLLQSDTLCFVYSPGKTSCVWIGDLPIETREALRLKRAAIAPEVANVVNVGREPSDASAGPPQHESAGGPSNVLVNGSCRRMALVLDDLNALHFSGSE